MTKHSYRVVGYHKGDVLATNLQTFWIDLESDVDSDQTLINADLDFVINLADKKWGENNWYELEFRNPVCYTPKWPFTLRKS